MAGHVAFPRLPPLFQHPHVRSAATSCVALALGDVACQALSNASSSKTPRGSRVPRSEGKPSKREDWWDFRRTGRFALVGLTLHGPYFSWGFRTLDRILPNNGRATLAVALGKTAVGQVTLFPVYLASFFTYMGLLEGRSFPEAVQKTKEKFWSTFKGGCLFWPAANIVNFMLVPPSGRVLYVNGAGLVWNTYLSWTNARIQSVEIQASELPHRNDN